MPESITSIKTGKGGNVEYSVVTEDGGLANNYPKLIEVRTECERYNSAYYFIKKEKADDFIRTLAERSN